MFDNVRLGMVLDADWNEAKYGLGMGLDADWNEAKYGLGMGLDADWNEAKYGLGWGWMLDSPVDPSASSLDILIWKQVGSSDTSVRRCKHGRAAQ